MILTLILLAFLVPDAPDSVGKMTHPAISEASGIVASRQYPGIFWVHNDSGNSPSLFTVRLNGTLVREYQVAATNLDWEDIAADDQGNLYIGDIGNNTRALPVRVIYRLQEPDPRVASDKPLPVTLASYYRYQKGNAFDAESLFLDGGRAILVTKESKKRDAELFAVSLKPAGSLLRPLKAEKVGSLPGFTDPATAADLSIDGTLLAVCSMDRVCVYSRDGKGGWALEGQTKAPPGQVEALCWDGRDLIAANEQRGIFRITEKAWRDGRKAKR